MNTPARRSIFVATAALSGLACTVTTEPFGPVRGRIVANRYGVTPTASLAGSPCPLVRPLDDAPCAATVPVGAHCEYPGGPYGDEEHIDPLYMVHVVCMQQTPSAAHWATVLGSVPEPDYDRLVRACAPSNAAFASCVDAACDGYGSAACACSGHGVAVIKASCPSTNEGCPPLRPHHGQPCVGTQGCDYDPCGRGARLECVGGIWQMALAVCP